MKSQFASTYINGKDVEKNDKKPRVTRHTFPQKAEDGGFAPEVIEIENAMGKDYIDQFIHLYSEGDVPFYHGLKGRTGSYVRFVTTHEPKGKHGSVAYFEIRTDATAVRYACDKALPLERKYLEHINKITEAALKARHGKNYKFIPYNALAIVVYDCITDPGFYMHDDKNDAHLAIMADLYPSHLIP